MHGLAILFWTYLFRFNLVFCFSTYPEHWKCSTIFSVFFSSLSRILTWLGLTRGGNEIGVFVNTYRGGFCEHELTDFHETFQVTSYHLTWHFETKMVSQSFLVFQLEPKYEKLFDGMRKLLNKKTYRICSKEHQAQLFFSFSWR